MNTVRDEIEKLEKMFDLFNAEFYGNELRRPIIQYMEDVKRRAYGRMVCYDCWRNTHETEDANRELTIFASQVTDNENVAETMLHEMTHLFALENGIQDVSNNGFYHNTKFKKIAEEHGLICERYKQYGWTATKLNHKALNFLNEHSVEFPQFRFNAIDSVESTDDEGEEKAKKGRPKMHTFVCPCCGEIVKSKNAELYIRCGECGEVYELVEDAKDF